MTGRALGAEMRVKTWALNENLLISATVIFIPRGNSKKRKGCLATTLLWESGKDDEIPLQASASTSTECFSDKQVGELKELVAREMCAWLDNIITESADRLWGATFVNHFEEFRWKTPCTMYFGEQKADVGSAFFTTTDLMWTFGHATVSNLSESLP